MTAPWYNKTNCERVPEARQPEPSQSLHDNEVTRNIVFQHLLNTAGLRKAA